MTDGDFFIIQDINEQVSNHSISNFGNRKIFNLDSLTFSLLRTDGNSIRIRFILYGIDQINRIKVILDAKYCILERKPRTAVNIK